MSQSLLVLMSNLLVDFSRGSRGLSKWSLASRLRRAWASDTKPSFPLSPKTLWFFRLFFSTLLLLLLWFLTVVASQLLHQCAHPTEVPSAHPLPCAPPSQGASHDVFNCPTNVAFHKCCRSVFVVPPHTISKLLPCSLILKCRAPEVVMCLLE